MTPKERLLAPLKKQKPDRPAFAADLTYWYSAAKMKKELPPEYEGLEGMKKLHEDLGTCCYYGNGAGVYKTSFDGVELNVHESSAEVTRQWKTAKGELTAK